MSTSAIVCLSIFGYVVIWLWLMRLYLTFCYRESSNTTENRKLDSDDYVGGFFVGLFWWLVGPIWLCWLFGEHVLVPIVTPGEMRKNLRKKKHRKEAEEAIAAAEKYQLPIPGEEHKALPSIEPQDIYRAERKLIERGTSSSGYDCCQSHLLAKERARRKKKKAEPTDNYGW